MRTTLAANQAEVWGMPISHSRSPALHTAAYRVLGWDASYAAREVDVASLEGRVESLDASWLGVSLTMPLKEAILPLVEDHRGIVDVVGVANTIVVREGQLYLENTDSYGVKEALTRGGVKDVGAALVLGAGATARSVLYALQQLQVGDVVIASRDQGRSERTLECAGNLGLRVSWISLEEVADVTQVDLVASTLPADSDVPEIPQAVVERSSLFDVSYHPWPSHLAEGWQSAGRPVISGMSMLVHQAVAQIRLFHSDTMGNPLPQEDRVLEAMWQAVGEPWASAQSRA